MSSTEWDRVPTGQQMFAPNWKQTEKGSVISVVLDCLVHTQTMVVGLTVPDSQRVRLIGEISHKVKGCRRSTALDAVLDFSTDSVDLLVTDSTMVVAYGLSPASDMLNLVELCAGVSCSSVGLTSAGFHHIGSVEWRPKLAKLHGTCHAGIPVITGDITEPSCICPATVRIAYLCQSPVLIVECVTQARSNRFVKSILQAMESQLGYHLTEISLRLEDKWAARRFHWWVVASHPALGPIHVPDLPKSPGLCIHDLMLYSRQWSSDVLQELVLTSAEEQLFTLDGSNMRRYIMQGDGKLPTGLHSWGSQAMECPCGCRQDSVSTL